MIVLFPWHFGQVIERFLHGGRPGDFPDAPGRVILRIVDSRKRIRGEVSILSVYLLNAPHPMKRNDRNTTTQMISS